MIRVLLVDVYETYHRDFFQILGRGDFSLRTTQQADTVPRLVREFDPQILLIGTESEASIHTLTRLRSQLQGAVKDTLLWIAVLMTESEELEIAAYQAGADAILQPPFGRRSLPLRLQTLANRLAHYRQDAYQIEHGPLRLDRRDFTVYWQDRLIPLGRREFDLIYLLARNPGRLYTRTELLESIVGPDSNHSPRTIDVHIYNLREKIGFDAIHTYKGKGYQLVLTK